jgi:tetratricopeptide (TPR) repeat protein
MRTTMLACLLLLTPIVSASAQDAPESSATPESSADAEARSIFDAARTAFNNGRYEEALEYFTRAYELSGRPELLYNLGQTLDRLDREAEALDHYRRFLVELPDTEMRGQAEGRIRIIEERLAAAEAAEAAAAAEVEAPRPAAFDPTGPAVLYATSGAALVVGGGPRRARPRSPEPARRDVPRRLLRSVAARLRFGDGRLLARRRHHARCVAGAWPRSPPSSWP